MSFGIERIRVPLQGVLHECTMCLGYNPTFYQALFDPSLTVYRFKVHVVFEDQPIYTRTLHISLSLVYTIIHVGTLTF